MKRWGCIALVFMLSLLSAGASLASSGTTEYRLEDGKLSVSIPDDMLVLTRYMSDAEFAAMGLEPAAVREVLGSTILLDALSLADNGMMEITVVMPYLGTDNTEARELRDFNRIDDAELLELFENTFDDPAFDEMLAGELPENVEHMQLPNQMKIYQHSQARFIHMSANLEQNGMQVYGDGYITIYDSKQYGVHIRRTDRPLNAADDALLKQVVDSIRFDAEPYTEPFESSGGINVKSIARAGLRGAIAAVVVVGIGGLAKSAGKKRKKEKADSDWPKQD